MLIQQVLHHISFGENSKMATIIIQCLNLGFEEQLKKLGLISLKYGQLRGDIEVSKFIKGRWAGYLQAGPRITC